MEEAGIYRLFLDVLPPGGLVVRLEKIRWTDRSFQVLAFLNLPAARVDGAGLQDPCFADAFYMYGAGERPPGQEVFLTASLTLRPALIAARGLSVQNELTLITQDLNGERLKEDLLDVTDVVMEPLD